MPGIIRLKGKGRVPVRKVRGEMNATERKYAEQLEARRLCSEIAGWWYEPVTFRLADRTTYTPDFMVVMLPDGTLEFHETKIYWQGRRGRKGRAGWQEDARVKIKVAAEMFPFTFKGAVLKDGDWIYEVF